MRKIFDQYGGVIVTVIAVVALIALVGFLMSSNGVLSNAFGNIVNKFVDTSTELIDAAENGGDNGSSGGEHPVTTTRTVKLDMVRDAGITFTQGTAYLYNGTLKNDATKAGSEFIPIENYEVISSSDAVNVTYCVWDADRNYLRGSWDCSEGLTLDPSQGDAYITLSIMLSEGQSLQDSASIFWMTRNVEVSNETKTFEIFGDSWSAYDTDIVNPDGAFYGETGEANNNDWGGTTDITDSSEMWYSLLEEDTGMTLARNDSISGSCLSYYHNAGPNDPNNVSFITRMESRFNDEMTEEVPDVLFIFGGTNDLSTQLGSLQYSDWTQDDLNHTLPSVCYMFALLKEHCPDTEVVFIMNNYVADEMEAGIKEACDYYGVNYILLPKHVTRTSSHPTVLGMNQIADKVLYDMVEAGILD